MQGSPGISAGQHSKSGTMVSPLSPIPAMLDINFVEFMLAMHVLQVPHATGCIWMPQLFEGHLSGLLSVYRKVHAEWTAFLAKSKGCVLHGIA